MNDPFAALEHVEIPIWVFDIDTGRIPWSNGLGLEYWGAHSVSELALRDMGAEMSAAVKQRLKQYIQDCQTFGTSFREYWTSYPNGIPQSAELIFSPFTFEDDRPGLLIQMLCQKEEVSSDSLRSTQALMHTSAMISLYGADLELTYSNPAARDVALRVAMTFSEHLVHKVELDHILACLEENGSCETECKVHTHNGIVWHAMSIQRSRDPVTGESSIIVSATDITERREAQQRALNLAYIDSLTGLPNRSALLGRLDDLIESCTTSQEKFALLYFDLDRFKLINDSLGHAIGDEMLKAFASIVSNCLQENDHVGRLAGDEFVALVTHVDDGAEVFASVQSILSACKSPAIVGGHALRISPSIGVSIFPDDAPDAENLLSYADLAMYAAKRSNQQYQFFESHMEQTSGERLMLENDISIALRKAQFELYYQPKVSAESGDIVGAEALIRWNHPTRGMVSPENFISIAEETGLIADLGQWVLERACADQVRWQRAGLHIPVAINISPLQFLSSNFVGNVRSVFNNSGVNPVMLDFEITESVLIGDKDHVLKIMDELHEYGVRFSIDDFGTGYSNLAYLQKYPLDSLKIDKTFLDDVSDTALLEIILGMAKILNLKVVAEGVETIEQVEWLVAHDCDELQGYFFSRPVPYTQLMQLLQAQDWSQDLFRISA